MRALLAAGCLLALPAISVPLWVTAHRSDLESPGDADLLEVPRADLPADRNGLLHFEAAGKALDLPESDAEILEAVDEGERWDPAWVEDRVRRNAPAFAALERGLAAPGLELPPDRSLEDATAVGLPLLMLAKLAGAEARLLHDQGRSEDAFERALLGMRVGRALAGASGAQLIHLMLADGQQSVSLVSLDGLVRRTTLSAETARALSSRLDSLRIGPEPWRNAWAAEYRWSKRVLLDSVVSPGSVHELLDGPLDEGAPPAALARLLPEDYLWQPNRTLARHAALYRELRARATRPCAEPWRNEPREPRSVLPRLGRNLVGEILLDLALPNIARFDTRRCGSWTRISLLQVAIAARAHRDRHGSLPERLQDLAPEYLDAVPLDPFDGRPLRYSKERRLAWSIGEDLVDSGGSAESSLRDRNEPTVSLAF